MGSCLINVTCICVSKHGSLAVTKSARVRTYCFRKTGVVMNGKIFLDLFM